MSTLPLSNDLDENYDRFIVEALETGCVWGLCNEEGWAVCPSEASPNRDVMPFWSQPEFAEVLCDDEWQDYEVTAVSTEEFLEEWLTGLHDDEVLVGVNWNENLEGDEIEPLDLLEDFDGELE
ncbi:DUF2750 domain-containing protein [Sessilibacter sp. MAH2]